MYKKHAIKCTRPQMLRECDYRHRCPLGRSIPALIRMNESLPRGTLEMEGFLK